MVLRRFSGVGDQVEGCMPQTQTDRQQAEDEDENENETEDGVLD